MAFWSFRLGGPPMVAYSICLKITFELQDAWKVPKVGMLCIKRSLTQSLGDVKDLGPATSS